MAPVLKVLDNPIVSHWLCSLRNKNSGNLVFRQAVELLSHAVFLEASSDFHTSNTSFESPVGPASGKIVNQEFAIIPILRAGIGMVDPILRWIADARVYHLGACRNHDTLQPEFYYNKLPNDMSKFHCLVLDPMLATGGSALETFRRLHKSGVQKISFLGLIGSRMGVENLHEEFPEVSITLAALDDELNHRGYIKPGLGDAGDRYFNT
ncbi:MAG: uracil phosphoribosyltransferase [Planctomycetes bacterium]|nr:uracil phosphoribosyltransferase [Planctomycetota bacterium]NBY02444.1 uracil phosphoribosyltransferase [Planctomycetota bacterium]